MTLDLDAIRARDALAVPRMLAAPLDAVPREGPDVLLRAEMDRRDLLALVDELQAGIADHDCSDEW